ncbi:unnamed protein product, partial [marine sediment metagenome]
VLISILYTLVFLGVGFLLIWSDYDGSLDWYLDGFIRFVPGLMWFFL